MTTKKNELTEQARKKTYSERKVYRCSNLKVLTDFMAILDINTPDIARHLDVSRQTIHHWLSSDDIKLSNLEKIFRSYGFSTICSFEKVTPKKKKTEGQILYTMGGLEPARLNFLFRAINDTGVAYKEIDKYMGVTYPATRGYLKKDDIHLKKLVEISRYLGMNLHIDIVPIKK